MSAKSKDQYHKGKIQSIRNTSVFSFFTSVSRILGFAREMLKSYAFGTSYLAVAFDVAFRIPNMLRSLVAEGAMTQSFLPVYEKYKLKPKEAARSIGSLLLFLFLFLAALSIVAWFLIPYIIPYLTNDPEIKHKNTLLMINLSQILFPYIIFISIAAIYMALQYSHGIFWSGSFGPAFLNLMVIFGFGSYFFGIKENMLETHEKDIYIFAIVVLFASVFQMFFQMWIVKRKKISPEFSIKSHPILKDMFYLMLPALFGASLQQISQVIDIYLATTLRNEVPAAIPALNYAHRLIQLPIGIFGVALTTSFLRAFSRLHYKKKEVEFSDNLFFSLRLDLFFLLPASIGLFLFSEPIISIVFERGNFDRESTMVTAYALKFYSIGLVAYSIQKLLVSAFYARKESITTAWVTAIALILNVVFSLSLMPFLQHGGLALGSSLAVYVSSGIYILLLKNRISFSGFSLHAIPLYKILFLNILFFLFLFLLKEKLFLYMNSIILLGIIFISSVFYIFLAYLFKLDEFFYLKKAFTKKV